MVWTCAAPVKLLEAAGVKFDPANGGAFRASTQAVSTSPENALEVLPIPVPHKKDLKEAASEEIALHALHAVEAGILRNNNLAVLPFLYLDSAWGMRLSQPP